MLSETFFRRLFGRKIAFILSLETLKAHTITIGYVSKRKHYNLPKSSFD